MSILIFAPLINTAAGQIQLHLRFRIPKMASNQSPKCIKNLQDTYLSDPRIWWCCGRRKSWRKSVKSSESSKCFKPSHLDCNPKIFEKPSEAHYIELSEIWETQIKETDPPKGKLSAEIETMGHLQERDHFCIKMSETKIVWFANWNSTQILYYW